MLWITESGQCCRSVCLIFCNSCFTVFYSISWWMCDNRMHSACTRGLSMSVTTGWKQQWSHWKVRWCHTPCYRQPKCWHQCVSHRVLFCLLLHGESCFHWAELPPLDFTLPLDQVAKLPGTEPVSVHPVNIPIEKFLRIVKELLVSSPISASSTMSV